MRIRVRPDKMVRLAAFAAAMATLGVTEAVRGRRHWSPFHRVCFEGGHAVFYSCAYRAFVRQIEVDHRVESAEDRLIQQLRVVGGGDDDAVGGVEFEELQERIQYPTDFANVVGSGAIAGQSIHLIEQIHTARLGEGVEDRVATWPRSRP